MTRSGLTQAQELERTEKAVRRKAAGFSTKQIAEELNFSSEKAALKCIKRALAKRVNIAVDDYVKLDLDLLDRIQRGLLADATTGKTPAVTALLKVMDHRAKLLGMYPKAEAAETDDGIRVIIDPRLLTTTARAAIEQEEVLEAVEVKSGP